MAEEVAAVAAPTAAAVTEPESSPSASKRGRGGGRRDKRPGAGRREPKSEKDK